MNFSKGRIEAIPLPSEGQRFEFHDKQAKGLLLRVSSAGTKTFCFYRWIKGASKPERITLGRFPAMTVEQARSKAAQLNAAVENGENPNEPLKLQKAEPTLLELFYDFIEHKRNKKGQHLSPKTVQEYRKSFTCYLEPWSKRKLSKIASAEMSALHKKLGKDRPTTANRTMALVSSLYNFGILERSYKVTNPAEKIKKYPENERDRFLYPDELPRFFDALAKEENPDMRDYFLLALLTGVRKSNVLAMRWDEIHLERGEWRIITKSNSAQTVTLSPEVIDILANRKLSAQSEWVFPGTGKTGHLVEPKKAWQRLLERAGLSDLRIHDLRRTLGSWQAKTGASLLTIGKSLNHKSTQSTAIYARLDLDPVRESVNRATAAMLNAAKNSA
ncbi:tyrosine-type recombinase/integrase [Methylotuvimicrobium buryatense]|uniref:Site-specific integrase n=1 Tax=Methylotuvimicrobium buryatense TaxID=95641 RepID=A0A4P9UKX4_METBY|nr:site-specific integrase [Methylotuvimicrobium buryatense]QCW80993.1 site-specific integrase [Methylotuvimicrobium buryatense]